MSDLTRVEAIESLEDLSRRYENAIHDYYGIARIEVHKDECEAVKVGIDSLKTDETYQIEYENRDFIEIPEGATLGDMLLEILKGREDCIYPVGNNEMAIRIRVEQWESPYRKEQE